MTLGQKQRLFATVLLPQLLNVIRVSGYEVTLGHALRDDDSKVGIANSLHKQKLAIDLNLFKNQEYLTRTEDHREFGEFWEQLGPIYGVKTAWGGRFNDGNHYSVEHGGVR